MAKIYLVRHGEAEASWDADADPGLSKDGHAQALALTEKLWKLNAQKAVCSPMRRCRETAGGYVSLSGSMGKMDIVEAVSEIPSPEGMTLDERGPWLRATFQQKWSEQSDDLKKWREDLLNFLGAITEDTVIFTHYVAINAAVGAATGSDDILVIRPDYCSYTTLEVENGKLTLIEKGEENTTKVN